MAKRHSDRRPIVTFIILSQRLRKDRASNPRSSPSDDAAASPLAVTKLAPTNE